MAKLLFLAWITLWFQTGDAAPGKNFTLRKNESASVRGTRISVQVISVGTTQSDEEGDRVFCSVKVKVSGRTESLDIWGGKTLIRAGNRIKLVGISFKTDRTLADPWAATSCTFIVTKVKK